MDRQSLFATYIPISIHFAYAYNLYNTPIYMQLPTLILRALALFLLILTPCNAAEDTNKSIKYVSLRKVPVSEENSQYYEQEWLVLQNALASQQYQNNGLKIQKNVITVGGIKKLMGYPIAKIKSLIIDQSAFNPETFKQLLSYNWFYGLQRVQFRDCNIFDEDLSMLPISKNTNIKFLNLQLNPISKQGFQYLGRLKMDLQELDLLGTSLIEDEAVDAVISYGLGNLVELNLCATGISGDNIIRILKAVDPTKFRILQICSNSLSLSFYNDFQSLDLPNLQILNLNDLSINSEGFECLSKKQVYPSLKQLYLQKNQLTSSVSLSFITKKRFPLLQKLIINADDNFFNKTVLEGLAREGFQFTELWVKASKMNPDGLDLVKQLSLQKMKKFVFGARSIDHIVMKNFILNNEFPELEQLQIEQTINVYGYLADMFTKKWPKLQSLKIDNLISIPAVLPSTPLFPKLKSLHLSITNTDEETPLNLLKSAQTIFPSIQSITMEGPFLFKVVTSIINGSYLYSVRNNITVTFISVATDSSFQVKMSPQKLPKVIHMEAFNVFQSFLFTKMGAKFEIANFIQLITNFIGYLRDFTKYVIKNLDFSQIEFLRQLNLLQIHANLLSQTPTKSYVFKYLRHLSMPITDVTNLKLLQNFTYPRVQQLYLKAQAAYLPFMDSSQTVDVNLQQMYHKFQYLTEFATDINLAQRQYFIDFFRNNDFKWISTLNLQVLKDIKGSDLMQIRQHLKYFGRIRRLRLNQVFINDGLDFLANSQIRPASLYFKNILFNTGVVKQLCSLNFQFVLQLALSQTGLTDKTIQQLIQCLQEKQGTALQFPKLKRLDLQKNYIDVEGMERVMNIRMPLLDYLYFDQNSNSDIFNTVFRSQWSKRISAFELKQKKYGSIDNMISPENTRRLRTLSITNSQLFQEDITTLANLQFDSLERLQITVSRVQKCQTLISLLKLTQNVLSIDLTITQSSLISSKCMSPSSSFFAFVPDSWIQPQSLVLQGNQIYGETAYLTSTLLNSSSEWKTLKIQDSILLNEFEVLQNIEKLSFYQIYQLAFKNCGINDQILAVISKQDLGHLQEIDLSGNEITAQGIANFFTNEVNTAKSWKKLAGLNLCNNFIGDEGVQILSKIDSQNLRQLLLSNTNITRSSILYLNKMVLPSLLVLDLSSNWLSFADLQLLNTKNMPALVKLIFYPSLTRKEYNNLQQKYRVQKPVVNNMILAVEIMTNIVEPSLIDELEVASYEGTLDDDEGEQEEYQQQ